MGIASSWQKEKDDDSTLDPQQCPMSTTAERFTSRVITAMEDEVDDSCESFNTALARLVDGMRRRVTFRLMTDVAIWDDNKSVYETFDHLDKASVEAGRRGIVEMVMVDGRALIKLEGDGGHRVLAFVGKDCKILGRWYRLVDWVKGRKFK